nr:phosphatidylglycerol lysyltransferase domain-containing protein [bacterium]
MSRISPLEIGHRRMVEERLAKFPPEVSEHTFTNLFIWRGSRPIWILESEGALSFLERRGDVSVFFGPPAGEADPRKLAQAATEAMGTARAAFARVPEDYAKSAMAAGFELFEDRANFDYVYRRDDLAELAGRRYHAKRNLVAQCLSQNDCTYEEIGSANLHEVKGMMEEWCSKRGCGHDAGLCDEFIAVGELLANYLELSVTGAAIRIEGKIAAFTVGERLNEKTAVIHFEKAMPEYKGLYQAINQLFAKNALGKFEFV